MPRILLPLLLCSLFAAQGIAQTLSPDTAEPDALRQLHAAQKDPYARVYTQALEIGDHLTAINALHHLLLSDPENTFLQDSLAAQYYYSGQGQVCRTWAVKCLRKRPESSFLLNLSAILAEDAGDARAALESYQRLYAGNGSAYYRYKVAGLQFQLGRHGECLANIEAMLQQAEIEKEQVHMAWPGGEGDVALRGALLNLRGNLELALNQEGKARKSFREALKVSPDFGLPRQNINALRQKDQERWEGNGDR